MLKDNIENCQGDGREETLSTGDWRDEERPQTEEETGARIARKGPLHSASPHLPPFPNLCHLPEGGTGFSLRGTASVENFLGSLGFPTQ